MDYRSAGVDISAGDEAVKRIKSKVRTTFSENVLSDIGLFGAFFNLDKNAYTDPVLVSSVDGVGTKLMVAIESGKHHTIGQDLVNHCVNDIAVCGAEPLFFLDYLAFGKLHPEVMEQIVDGFALACRENGCALIGGETAEMPGLYETTHYDMSGTIVGIVEKNKIINGSRIEKGNVLLGFPSSGLHTNGYSLARKVLQSRFNLNQFVPELNCTLSDELLKIHKSYLSLIKSLKNRFDIRGFSHITGGGIEGNTYRILRGNQKLKVDWTSWERPQIYNLIQTVGEIAEDEMRRVFNLGIGLIVIVSKDDVKNIIDFTLSIGESVFTIGEVV
ncbi:MAG: phosphoribosylformylglycinamidine cyclo-ligase [Ignavibacteriaceae bacterium]|nr:phosphoribosylformylglycinamidine cyclo-ligase [Ignavibacteriaceae bacterium]